MNGHIEVWESDARWKHLNSILYSVADGKLSVVSANEDNPLLQFRQNVSMGVAIESIIFPDDDLQFSLVIPSSSLQFNKQNEITYFGLLYERQFGVVTSQFVLTYRTSFGESLLNITLEALPNLTAYRVLLTARGDTVRLKVFSMTNELLRDATVTGAVTGEMTFLANPGRSESSGAMPWIGRTVFAWGGTEQQIIDIEDAGTIEFPPIQPPIIKVHPAFIEGVFKTWVGPSIGASGALTVEPTVPLPGGLTAGMQGGSLVIFGAPVAGTAGSYPISFIVSDGLTSTTIAMELIITVGSRWTVDPGITDDVAALGDYYYQIAGGPVRKEFTYPEGSP